MDTKRNGLETEQEPKTNEMLTLKARFFDLLRHRELVELEMKQIVQKINQLEKGNA